MKSQHIVYMQKRKKLKKKQKTFKTLAPTWNEKFELPNGSYSVSGIEDYF